MNKTEFDNLAEQLKDIISPVQVIMGQAASVCSIITHLGLLRATTEDIVDGLFERFGGLMEKEQLSSVTDDVISFGLCTGLFDRVDEDSISLSQIGMIIGRDWLAQLQQDPA